MNRERLLALADVIEAEPDHFDMRWWVRTPTYYDGVFIADVRAAVSVPLEESCGTTFCLAGITVALWGGDLPDDFYIAHAAMVLLELTLEQAEALLYQESGTAAQVAGQIRELVAADAAWETVS